MFFRHADSLDTAAVWKVRGGSLPGLKRNELGCFSYTAMERWLYWTFSPPCFGRKQLLLKSCVWMAAWLSTDLRLVFISKSFSVEHDFTVVFTAICWWLPENPSLPRIDVNETFFRPFFILSGFSEFPELQDSLSGICWVSCKSMKRLCLESAADVWKPAIGFELPLAIEANDLKIRLQRCRQS